MASSLADRCRYPIRGLTDSADDVIESRGRFAADGGALGMARRGVQGVTLARRDEVGEHQPGVGVQDGQLAIQMVADEGRNHDVEGAAAVESLQRRSEMSRQFLQACVIGLSLKLCVRLTIVCPWHGPSLLFSSRTSYYERLSEKGRETSIERRTRAGVRSAGNRVFLSLGRRGRPTEPVPDSLTKPVQLQVNGLAPSGLQDSFGRLIDGDHNGTAGGNAIAILSKTGATVDAVELVRTQSRPATTSAVVDALLERGELAGLRNALRARREGRL